METSDVLTIIGLVIVLAVAAVGWVLTTRTARNAQRTADEANTHADDSNQIASQALELARSAEDRAQRLEDQAVESRDVSWERLSETDGVTLSFRNVGADDAHDVKLIVEPIHEHWDRRTEQARLVPGGQRIWMNLTAETDEVRRRAAATMRNSPPDVAIGVVGVLHVRAHITWRSSSGIPGSQDFEDVSL